MSEIKISVVITTCEGREDNLRRVLQCVASQTHRPHSVVVVYDGCVPPPDLPMETITALIRKHEPGEEQPRNIGVWVATGWDDEPTHVWFLDSDLVFGQTVLETYYQDLVRSPDRILMGPYDWMPPGHVLPMPDLHNDPRWASFDQHHCAQELVGELGPALACFGGNLVWPVEEFREIGGFHPQLHHGRCEDGELGLRAASREIPMSFVRDARAWHVDHPRDVLSIYQKNSRDVPLINKWHPWVEGQGLIVTEKDGARFDFVCPDCKEQVNSLEYWTHRAQH